MLNLGLTLGLGARGVVGPGVETLPLPFSFPVTFQRSSTAYSVRETAADWYADYTGATVHVATTGNDTTGDGSSGAPYATLNKAITEATSLDIVSIAPGIYAMPSSAVAKNLAFIAPSGGVYLGQFNNLTTATITANAQGWNVNISGGPIQGWLRTDGVIVQDTKSCAQATSVAMIDAYTAKGVPGLQQGAASANVNPGNGDNFATLVSGGHILAWLPSHTQSFSVTGQVFIGQGITLASSNNTGVVQVGATGLLIGDRFEAYGSTGSGSCISSDAGGTSILFGVRGGGAESDLVDYRGASTAVEVDCVFVWPGSATMDNASTGHDNAKVLRVGGTYRGGSRTIHDIQATQSFVFSCSVGDPQFNDKVCIRVGDGGSAGETCVLSYGDITFLNTWSDGAIVNTSADSDGTLVQIELSDPWPY